MRWMHFHTWLFLLNLSDHLQNRGFTDTMHLCIISDTETILFIYHCFCLNYSSQYSTTMSTQYEACYEASLLWTHQCSKKWQQELVAMLHWTVTVWLGSRLQTVNHCLETQVLCNSKMCRSKAIYVTLDYLEPVQQAQCSSDLSKHLCSRCLWHSRAMQFYCSREANDHVKMCPVVDWPPVQGVFSTLALPELQIRPFCLEIACSPQAPTIEIMFLTGCIAESVFSLVSQVKSLPWRPHFS